MTELFIRRMYNLSNTIIQINTKPFLGNYVQLVRPGFIMTFALPQRLTVKVNGNSLLLQAEVTVSKELYGTFWKLLYNALIDMGRGYKVSLSLKGVGYKAYIYESRVKLELGYSHVIYYKPPVGISIRIIGPKRNVLIVKGYDRQKVKEVAWIVKNFRFPDSYKGKGIVYRKEVLNLKAGKKAYQ